MWQIRTSCSFSSLFHPSSPSDQLISIRRKAIYPTSFVPRRGSTLSESPDNLRWTWRLQLGDREVNHIFRFTLRTFAHALSSRELFSDRQLDSIPMADEGFLKTLNEFIQVTNEIITKLRGELEWIENYHAGSVAVKTVGTTASVIGAGVMIGALALAPFTGGASIVAATGYGALTCTIGGVVNLATDLVDIFAKRAEESKIEFICLRRNSVAQRLQEYFHKIENTAIELKKLHVEEGLAYLLSMWNIARVPTKWNWTKIKMHRWRKEYGYHPKHWWKYSLLSASTARNVERWPSFERVHWYWMEHSRSTMLIRWSVAVPFSC